MTRMQRKVLGGSLQIVGSLIALFGVGFMTFGSAMALGSNMSLLELTMLFGAILATLVISISMILGGASIYEKSMKNVCPKCEYDLRGQTEEGCPECGWHRLPL